jgi:hypothetical protein
LIGLGCVAPPHYTLAPRVSKAGIRAVQLGMTRPQVEAILGRPLRLDSRGGLTFLLYYRKRLWIGRYPILAVNLERDGTVGEVIAYVHESGSRRMVYSLSSDGRREEKDFERYFPAAGAER